MSQISVLVTTASSDFWAEVIAESVTERSDMSLVEGRSVKPAEVDQILESLAPSIRCALVLVGRSDELSELANRWILNRNGLVVMHVDMGDDIVRIGLRDPRLASLLSALRELVESAGTQTEDRIASIKLRMVEPLVDDNAKLLPVASDRPLLHAAFNWVHALFKSVVEGVSDDNGDVYGLSITRATILESLDPPSRSGSDDQHSELSKADEALDLALSNDENLEPLAVAARVFGLERLTFRVMVLTLSPDLDFRFQRCIGFLLDDMSRRAGTLSLYGDLLEMTANELGEVKGGALSRWLVLDAAAGHRAAADEPARIDPFLAQWLFGETSALEQDSRVRRCLRAERWPGASLLVGHTERAKAEDLINKLRGTDGPHFVVFEGPDAGNWRAMLELGAKVSKAHLIRVDVAQLRDVDVLEIKECAQRIGRLIRLTGSPLAIDVSGPEFSDQGLRAFLSALSSTDCPAALICNEVAQIVPLLGSTPFELIKGQPLTTAARVEAVFEAAKRAGAVLTSDRTDAVVNRYPLDVDGLEQAALLARSRSNNYSDNAADLERFQSACKELASQGVSQLVDRIEPIFTLDDVVLPPDRKRQLNEIVDHVRFASRVLDDWKFGEKLPYGRGVAVLFSGPSGTGKTMAAMGIAHQLGIQLLRLDLSKVVSKFIGETEKNISRVFTDAQHSGAAVLIDEADALLGKRSEVKEAHDRYANIEVAYLLQRMETFEGLVILTTNMRKNLDQAFLRRLREMVDFPKPDVEARESIWRQCLPVDSHELDDGDFRQLARRIDLTGGQIRQITLRAAFIAIAADHRIGLEDIARATHAELTKLGMPPIEIVRTEARRAA